MALDLFSRGWFMAELEEMSPKRRAKRRRALRRMFGPAGVVPLRDAQTVRDLEEARSFMESLMPGAAA